MTMTMTKLWLLAGISLNLFNFNPTAHAMEDIITQTPTHLTLQQLALLLNSEAITDFDSPSLLAKTALWEEANKYEWSKALKAETDSTSSSSAKYPYLICHIGQNMSGWQRRLAISDAVMNNTKTDVTAADAADSDTKAENGVYLHTLHNTDDYLCVYGQLLASVAITLTNEELIVQPVLPSLKMIEGAVEGMKEEHVKGLNSGSGEKYYPKVDMSLCPGVAVAKEEEVANNSGSSSGEQSYLIGSDGTILDQGEDLKGAEDITEYITNLLLSESLTDNTNSSAEVYDLSQEFYMTSQTYSDYLNNSTNNTAAVDEELSERSQMWGKLIDDYQTSGVCDETYKTRLTWKIYRSTQPERASSQMQLVYNNTGETDTDAGCALTLLLAISANPDVCSVDVRRGVEPSNRIASFMVESEIENVTPFRARGIDGTGQTVAVSDTGVDRNNCYFLDPSNDGQPVGITFDSAARKIGQYIPFADSSDYQYGHGTHVAGTIAGKRWDGPGAADGIAPGATLAMADIGNANGDLFPPNDSTLLSTGRPFAQIHSASWGSAFNFYTSRARNFDQFMFENDEFLIMVAAGNSGSGDGAFDVPNTVGDPATAKNVIAVGAHNSWGSSSQAGNLGPSFIADFSSRGPTADRRMKPDIMAVGKSVLSAGALPSEVGECDPSRTPGPNSQGGGLLSLQGTSMATPVVSGTAAIIRQYFADGYYPSGMKNSDDAYPNPSGALVKAVLMNGAQPLNGVDNGVNGVTEVKLYDNNQGFGRISLQDSVYLASQTNVQLKAWDRETVVDQETNTYDVTIDKSNGCQAENLSVTLVWVEEGSSPGCMSCVLNDLDLSVTFRGQTFYPNGLKSPDRTNIVERVIINGVQGGETATISVQGYNLAWRTQKYALVATGCFGGVANTLQGANVFDNDNSQQRRRAIIISIVVVLVVLLIVCVTVGCIRRRKARSGTGDNYDFNRSEVEESA